MIHILFIDPLAKLTLNKDSSLQFALTLKARGISTYFLFEKDLYYSNTKAPQLKVYPFSGEFAADGICPEKIELEAPITIDLGPLVLLHMRIDPPFDTRYLRYLWILSGLQRRYQIQVMNKPDSIAITNEKLESYLRKDSAPTFVGSSIEGLLEFMDSLKDQGHRELILKPLDLYQGIGVEKISFDDPNLEDIFAKRVREYAGALVAQPYLKAVEQGEVRSIFFKAQHIGSIIKKPKEGGFISNIAFGASYEAVTIDSRQHDLCRDAAIDLGIDGLPWVAFDLLGNQIQEMNITCPGLLVEVSKAHAKNLALDIINLIDA